MARAPIIPRRPRRAATPGRGRRRAHRSVTDAAACAAWDRLAGGARPLASRARDPLVARRRCGGRQPRPSTGCLGLAAVHAAPLALAVVPAWLDETVAAQIRESPAPVRVVQHGYAHRNHEPPAPDGTRGKPAELGAARAPDIALAELAAGWARLAGLVPTRLRPGLVPPWNRIAPAIAGRPPRRRLPRAVDLRAERPAERPAADLRMRSTPTSTRSSGGPVSSFRGTAWTLDQITAHLADRRGGRVDPAEPTGLAHPSSRSAAGRLGMAGGAPRAPSGRTRRWAFPRSTARWTIARSPSRPRPPPATRAAPDGPRAAPPRRGARFGRRRRPGPEFIVRGKRRRCSPYALEVDPLGRPAA